MARLVFIFVLGMTMMLGGVSLSSSLSAQAVEMGHDSTIIGDIMSPKRLAILGVAGSYSTSLLIFRGKETVIPDGVPDSLNPIDSPAR